MKAVDIPDKFPIPFADQATVGFIRPVPETPSVEQGAASLELGFPPITFDPVGAGGVPPFGQDVNGILNQTTATVRWLTAGGPVAYDATFQSDIGGYPAGALVMSASAVGTWWLSTVDDNATNPDAAGAGWTMQRVGNAYAVSTGTANALVVALAPALTSYATGLVIFVRANLTNSGAATINAGVTAVAVRRLDNGAAQAGDIQAGCVYMMMFDGALFRIVGQVPSSISGAGLAPDGAGKVTVDILGLPSVTNPNVADLVMIQKDSDDTLAATTVGGISGTASQSDAFYSLMMLLGGAT